MPEFILKFVHLLETPLPRDSMSKLGRKERRFPSKTSRKRFDGRSYVRKKGERFFFLFFSRRCYLRPSWILDTLAISTNDPSYRLVLLPPRLWQSSMESPSIFLRVPRVRVAFAFLNFERTGLPLFADKIGGERVVSREMRFLRGEEKRWLGGANVEGEKEFSFSFFLRAYSSTRTLSPAISAVLLELWNLV